MLKTQHITRPTSLDELLDASLIDRLNQLDVSSRRLFAGKLKGERRSKKRGESVEFADHRPYIAGDDVRHVDWNAYARLDRLFLKLFLEEEDLSLHIALDASASMGCGEPGKFLLAQRLTAALASIGLINLNRVALTAIGEPSPDDPQDTSSGAAPSNKTLSDAASRNDQGGVRSNLRNLRGRHRLTEAGRWICSLEPAGADRFTDAARRIALSRQGKGVMVLISDFFFKDGYEQGLRYLMGRGYDVFLIQVLSPQEIDPTLGGDLRLRDIETAGVAEVTISASLLKRYKQHLSNYCRRLGDFCARRDITLLTVSSDTPVDTLVLDTLRARGLLR